MEHTLEPKPPSLLHFRQAAENVAAIVHTMATLEEAISYTVDLCERKEACRLLLSGCSAPLSEPATDLCSHKQHKIIAAPLLTPESAGLLADKCEQHGLHFIQKGLRDHLAGIDIGFTMADYGIAETGTLVIDASSEEIRLATMICEIHVAVLPADRIRATAFDIEDELRDLFGATPNYCAFITGASRTADIERVLTLGVHGPLELHILLLENN